MSVEAKRLESTAASLRKMADDLDAVASTLRSGCVVETSATEAVAKSPAPRPVGTIVTFKSPREFAPPATSFGVGDTAYYDAHGAVSE